MKHKAEFTLGLLGGVLGILSGILIIKTDLFKVVVSDKEGTLLIGMFVILCSVFAVITSLFIEYKPREVGLMFFVSGALGLLIFSFFILSNSSYCSLLESWFLLKAIKNSN